MRYQSCGMGQFRRGTTLWVWVLSFSMLLGVVALVLDGGTLLYERRKVQAAADAAALAAASDLYNGSSTNTAEASALKVAADNGYPNSYVSVNPNYKPNYVEVVVTSNLSKTFSAIFPGNNLQVKGRAVARGVNQATSFGGGILLLAPTGLALKVQDHTTINVNANITINSSDQTGAMVVDKNATIKANEIDIFGNPGYNTDPKKTGTINATVKSGVSPASDPLAYLDPPDLNDTTSYPLRSSSQMQITKDTTLLPGVYVGGIGISGKAKVTLSPGIYYLQGGGLVDSGQGTITGNGVMIYNGPDKAGGTTGSLSVSGNGDITLSPPTTGPYKGITIFQDRTSTAEISVSGNGEMDITGVFYAAKAPLTIVGNGEVENEKTATIGSQYIVDSLFTKGNGTFNLQKSGGENVSGPTITRFGLVE